MADKEELDLGEFAQFVVDDTEAEEAPLDLGEFAEFEVTEETPVEAPPVLTPEVAGRDIMAGAAMGGVGLGARREEVDPAAIEARVAGRGQAKISGEELLRTALGGATLGPEVPSKILQRGEAALFNIPLAMQQKRDVLSDFVAGLSGERLGRMADVFEKSGSPKLQAEVLGLTAEAIAGDVLSKVARTGAKAITKPLKRIHASFKTPPLSSRLANELKNVRRASRASIESSNKAIKSAIDKTNKQFGEFTTALSDDLNKAAFSGSGEFQAKLPEFFKRNSDAYGQVLDEMNDTFIKRGGSITDEELVNVLNKTFAEAEQNQVAQTGMIKSKLDNLAKKYTQEVETTVSPILDASGRPIISTTEVEPKNIDLKNVLNDIRNINKSMRKAFTSGFSDEDIVGAIFNKNWGEFLEAKGIPIKELNAKYKPFIEAKKQANRIFKPFKGEFDRKTGEGLLKRIGKGTASETEQGLIRFLEEGSQFGEGVGDITSNIRAIGKEIDAAKKAKTEIIRKLRVKKGIEADKLKNELGEAVRIIEEKQLELATRNRNRKVAMNIIKALGISAAGIATVKRLSRR